MPILVAPFVVLVLASVTDGYVLVLAGRALCWVWQVEPLSMTALGLSVLSAAVALLVSGRPSSAPPPGMFPLTEQLRIRYGPDPVAKIVQPVTRGGRLNDQSPVVGDGAVAPVVPIRGRWAA